MTQRRPSTADKILDVAERLLAVRGFNGFSYADVSEALGLQKASLHHHFPTKADLGEALVKRYRDRFVAALEAIEVAEADPRRRIERYVDLYRSTLRRKRMCLCGMLATDAATLPKPMPGLVASFFKENEDWLGRILAEGRGGGALAFEGSAQDAARFVVGALEGAMLVARLRGGEEWFDAVARTTLSHLGCPGDLPLDEGAAP